jgi:hypothetical protein
MSILTKRVLKSITNLKPPMELQTLAEVDVIRALPEGGYEVKYLRRDKKDPSNTTQETVTADVVIVSAGCVGTNEILLRSKARGTLPGLSEKLGFGFSTNGDYIAFLENTREHLSLVRGPVTTSYAHFNTGDPLTGDDATGATFHTLEDQGIPPAMATLVGQGVPLIESLSKGRHKLALLGAMLHEFFDQKWRNRFWKCCRANWRVIWRIPVSRRSRISTALWSSCMRCRI